MAGDERGPAGWTRGRFAAVFIGTFGGLVGAKALGDNSFLTHLTTGRLLLQGHLPSTDPYSFTAHGEPWVIQSWFASLLYGVADHVAGGLGLRILIMVVSMVLALLVWRLTRRAGTIAGRILSVVPALMIGSIMWGARPMLFGLLFFALLLLILEERHDPRWVVPLLWVWVNTHGSFPLGIALIVAVTIGVKIDGMDTSHPVAALKWAGVGLIVSMINPVGPRLLWFPIQLLQKQDVLSHMVEWQAPNYQSNWQRIFLVTVVVAALLAPRLPVARRYRVLLPGVVFAAAGLYSVRNIPLASIVLLPVLALELRGLGSIVSSVRRPSYRVVGVVGVVTMAALIAVRLGPPNYNFSDYPVSQFNWLAARGKLTPRNRIAAPDIVGNYVEFRTSGRQPVFVDDRVDMFPRQVINDELTLVQGGGAWSKVLDRWKIDTVVWQKSTVLVSWLAASPDHWKLVQSGPGNADNPASWVIYERVKP